MIKDNRQGAKDQKGGAICYLRIDRNNIPTATNVNSHDPKNTKTALPQYGTGYFS